MENIKTAILIHGMPSKEEYFDSEIPASSKRQWLPWLQKQLSARGVVAQTPEMPEPFRPDYDKWRQVFEQLPIDQGTALVGHSCGGGFLVRWLSENNVKVGKVILVAPWIDPASPEIVPGFFDFQIDPNLASKTESLHLFISSDDEQDVLDTAEMIESEVSDVQVHRFTDRGHFCVGFNLKDDQFPELLKILE